MANCYRSIVHQSVRNRVFGKKKLTYIVVASTGDITFVASPLVVEVFNEASTEKKSNANSLGIVLQAEDTMNFKMKAPLVCSACLLACLSAHMYACLPT